MSYNLSYPMQEKTKRIIEFCSKRDKLEQKLSKTKKHFLICIAINVVLGLICTQIFLLWFESFTTTTDYSLSGIDIFLLISLGISMILSLYKYTSISIIKEDSEKLMQRYEKLRHDIIETINHDFCSCHILCTCKDEYIKEMKKSYNIDLISK